MGDPVRVVGSSPGRPVARGTIFAGALAVGALLAALAMLAPAADAQMYYPQTPAPGAPAPSAPAAPAYQYAAPSTTAAQQQATNVTIQDFFFAPAQITVQPGTTVTWVNGGQAPHTVTADDGSFDSETLQPGQSFSFTFQSAGTFTYFCEIHPFMTGSVTVGGGGGAAPASAQAQPTGGRQALPGTGGPSLLLPAVFFLLLGCGALGAVALRRARRTSARQGDA